MTADHGALDIMIVDDDAWTTRALALELASDSTLSVSAVCSSGEEALATYPVEKPDVVLMDINMPGISGVDATEKLLGADPAARIVILSTVAPGPGLARALAAGAVSAVHKTAAVGSLANVIRLAAGEEPPSLVRHLAGKLLLSDTHIADAPPVFAPLTEREREVLLLICDGMPYDEIATHLHLSVNTVKTHARLLREKLSANTLAQLVVEAVRHRYVTFS